jgi:hypothetical protein
MSTGKAKETLKDIDHEAGVSPRQHDAGGRNFTASSAYGLRTGIPHQEVQYFPLR